MSPISFYNYIKKKCILGTPEGYIIWYYNNMYYDKTLYKKSNVCKIQKFYT